MTKPLHRNTLLRYKIIRDIYLKHKTEDIPDSVILKKYIYPRFPISRTTFNTILCTPIDKLLSDSEQPNQQS